MTLLTMHRAWRGRGIPSGGGGGGGGGASWRSALRAFPYTPPTGIDAYGVGTVLDTTWNLAGQTGTTHTCTTQAHVTTALGAANPGDKIVISANIAAPAGGWTLGNRGTGTIYIVSDYINAGTFERRASVSDWGTLSTADWATEIAACRARKADTYRVLENDTGNNGIDPIFKATAARSTYWVIAGFEMRANTTSPLTSFSLDNGLVTIQNTSATIVSECAGRVWIDRCYLHVSPTQNTRRLLNANGTGIAVTNSTFAEVHERTYGDCQAIARWEGGPGFKCVNNTIEGTGVNVIFGGSTILAALHPTDVEFRANHVVSPKGVTDQDSEHATSAWSSVSDYRQKCLFECKFVKRLWVEGNVFQHTVIKSGVWGFEYALQIQSLAQGVSNEFVITENAAFRQNRVIGACGGMNITARGVDFTTTGPTQNIGVLDLLMTDIGSNGDDRRGVFFNAPGALEMYGVTIDEGGSGVKIPFMPYGLAEGNITVNGLVAPYGTYGILNVVEGDAAVDAFANGKTITWSNNVLWGGSPSASDYNGSCATTLLANRSAVGFDNPAADDYDVTGTYATNKCNASLVRSLTDAVNVEGYA